MQINTISPSQVNNSQSSTSVQNQQQNIPQQTQAATGSEKTSVVHARNAVNASGQTQNSEKNEAVGRQANESAKGTENTRLDVFA